LPTTPIIYSQPHPITVYRNGNDATLRRKLPLSDSSSGSKLESIYGTNVNVLSFSAVQSICWMCGKLRVYLLIVLNFIYQIHPKFIPFAETV